MRNCVYLAASLPALYFGDPPPYTPAEFRFRCQGVLDGDGLKALDAVLAGEPGPSVFGAEWQARETQLRNAVARLRAARRGGEARQGERPHTGFSVTLEQGVADAFTKPDPLAREMDLDRLRWRTAEELARTEPFGLPAVLAFAVKLKIAARWSGMKDEAGRAAVGQVLDANDPARAAPQELDN